MTKKGRYAVPPLNEWAAPTGKPVHDPGLHTPMTAPVMKLSSEVGRCGSCSCGWRGNGILTEGQAMKSARAHVKDNINLELKYALIEAHLAVVDPDRVIDAVAALNKDRHDMITTAWEHGAFGFFKRPTKATVTPQEG